MIHPDVSGQAEDGCLTRGNPEKFIGPALVAYIDILGMSNALINNWGAHPSSALQRLLRIKNTMPRDDQESQVTISIYDPSTNKDIEKYLSVTRTLSDSIVSMMAMPAQCASKSFFLRVQGLLLTVRIVWRNTLEQGFTVRGAIEFGEMFWNETEFTGPGLVCAYGLEKKASTSRIVVGPRLLEKVVEVTKGGIPLDHPLNPNNAFVKSADGRIAVDPHHVVGAHLLPCVNGLRDDAGQDAQKYEELVRILETPRSRVSHPSLSELATAWGTT